MEIKQKIKEQWEIEILDKDVKFFEDYPEAFESYWFAQKLAQHYGLVAIPRTGGKKGQLVYEDVEKTPFCNTEYCKEYVNKFLTV